MLIDEAKSVFIFTDKFNCIVLTRLTFYIYAMLLILARPGQGTGTYIFPLTNVKISLKILIVKKN
jgi:hypothetical protein